MTANTGHSFYRATGWITFVILFQFVYSQLYIGDFCTIPSNNATGKCKFLKECPKAIEDLQNQKIYPRTCGFEGPLPVVCCNEKPAIENRRNEERVIPARRKSKQKCKEYCDEYDTNISLTYSPGSRQPIKENCVHSDGFRIRGNKALPREFPHMAAIGYEVVRRKKSWLCSGVLISEKFVLTAAHCLSNHPSGQPKYIRIGDVDLGKDNADSSPQEFNVAGIFVHPYYNPPSVYNDLGLLALDRMARFTVHARPACLYTNSTLPSQPPIVMGWGREDFSSDISSNLLMEILNFFSHAECESSYRNISSERNLKHGIVDDTQICAGPRRRQDTCVAGTGALITYNTEGNCMYNLIGMTSFSRECGNDDVPDVFTRVSAYIPWIEEIVWPS